METENWRLGRGVEVKSVSAVLTTRLTAPKGKRKSQQILLLPALLSELVNELSSRRIRRPDSSTDGANWAHGIRS